MVKNKKNLRTQLILEILSDEPLSLSELTKEIERHPEGWNFPNSYKTLFRELEELQRKGVVRFSGSFPRVFSLVKLPSQHSPL